MSTKNTETTPQAETPAPQLRLCKCRVLVDKLELPHGIAAKGAVVHLHEDDTFKRHETARNIQFIAYV